MTIQAIIFDNTKWTDKTAKKWLREHNYVQIKPVHRTKNFLRYRLRPPELFKSFYIKKIGNGIELILGISS